LWAAVAVAAAATARTRGVGPALLLLGKWLMAAAFVLSAVLWIGMKVFQMTQPTDRTPVHVPPATINWYQRDRPMTDTTRSALLAGQHDRWRRGERVGWSRTSPARPP
jgi:hypothetical protein